MSLSDALGEAILLNDPATLQEKAEVVAMAKYHTTALIGILRSHLGAQHDRETYKRRLIYVMVSTSVCPVDKPFSRHVDRKGTRSTSRNLILGPEGACQGCRFDRIVGTTTV